MKTPPRDVLLEAADALERRARGMYLTAEGREQEMDFRQFDDPKESARQLRERADRLRAVACWLDYSVDGPRAQANLARDQPTRPGTSGDGAT